MSEELENKKRSYEQLLKEIFELIREVIILRVENRELKQEKQELIEYIKEQLTWNITPDDYVEANIYTDILNKLKGDD